MLDELISIVTREITNVVHRVNDLAISMFEMAGGSDWRTDLAIGGASAALGLLCFVFLVSAWLVSRQQG